MSTEKKNRYYTNVARSGNNILVREVRNGIRRSFKHEYKPTLYVPTDQPTEFHATDGTPVRPIQPGTMRECKELLERYDDVSNKQHRRFFGNTGYEYAFIQEYYPGQLEYDIADLVVCNLDIEVASTQGFPEPEEASEEVTAITVKNSQDGIYTVFACGEFNNTFDDVHYEICKDETDLLRRFLFWWEQTQPDIITGWNCLPLTASVWGNDQIHSIDEIAPDQALADSKVTEKFPTTVKAVWKMQLDDGRIVESSKDHIFPIRWKKPNTYSKLTGDANDLSMGGDVPVRDIERLIADNDVFCKVVLHENINQDAIHPVTGDPLSDDLCYVLGCIFTDGSYSPKHKVVSFYNTRQDVLSPVYAFFQSHKRKTGFGNGITTDKDGCHRIRTSLTYYNPLTAIIPWICEARGHKRLDVSALSRLSKRQFTAFVSGMIDGDGCISLKSAKNRVGITIANKIRRNREVIQELANWNGVIAHIQNVSVYFPFDEINQSFIESLRLHHGKKHERLSDASAFSRKRSSSKLISRSFAADRKSYWVRVSSIESTTNYVPMVDIGTNTHYFYTAGVKTHNCRTFDAPYLVNRITKIMSGKDAKRLSPWGQLRERTVNIFNKPYQVYDIVGVSLLDYLMIYKKNVLEPRESYRLDAIAQVELGEGKVDYGQYSGLQELYEQDFNRFIVYNIKDVRLVDRIDAKRRLIELQLIVAYHMKVNYEDVMSQVRAWDAHICDYLLQQKVVVPMKSSSVKSDQFTGAYVMQPIPGMYEWVVSFDVNSLYPTIMRTLNIGIESKLQPHELTPLMRAFQAEMKIKLLSPNDEGKSNVNIDAVMDAITPELLAHAKEHDVTIAANGQFYRRNPKSFYSILIESLIDARTEYRRKLSDAEQEKSTCTDNERIAVLDLIIANFDLKQKATKVALNSLYGATGNEYFRFFDVLNAEAVTTTGQFIIQLVARLLNVYLNKHMKTTGVRYVVYSDTDSVILTVALAVTKYCPDGTLKQKLNFVDRLSKEALQKEIGRIFELINTRYLNAAGRFLKMGREVIGDKAIWTAKKRYLIYVRDKEGIRKPDLAPSLKSMGVEISKSTVPKFCREAMKKAVAIVMEKDQETLYQFIADTRSTFFRLPIEDIALPKSVNGLEKYGDAKLIYSKGTQAHAKGALLFNHLIDKMKLGSKYQKLRDGEKIKFVYLRMPNKYANINAMAFSNQIPPEFRLEELIDRNVQWEKTFVEPMMLILGAIGWNTEQKASLNSLFE